MVNPQGPTDPQAALDPLSGTPYRLVRRVTAGAMGEILEAEHVRLRRRVIVKLVHRVYATLPGFRDRFRLEAQALATIAPRTPHVVAVLDFGETGSGIPFLALEQLSGRTLEKELTMRGALPPAEAVQLARELLDALGCAHDAGILHRDVKPENIFLAEPERGGRILKLLDFGIAKVLPGAADADGPAPLALPTEEGVTLGTPRFLAPEQARGTSVDQRADLYAVGAVLYAMLTGGNPYAHVEGVAAVLFAQATEPPRPPSIVASQAIPEALDRVVLKALAKRPDDRFASAAEFSAALERSLTPDVPLVGGGTERMDLSVFHGARRRPMPDRTEPLNVNVFHGARSPVAPPAAAPAVPPAAATAVPPAAAPAAPAPVAPPGAVHVAAPAASLVAPPTAAPVPPPAPVPPWHSPLDMAAVGAPVTRPARAPMLPGRSGAPAGPMAAGLVPAPTSRAAKPRWVVTAAIIVTVFLVAVAVGFVLVVRLR